LSCMLQEISPGPFKTELWSLWHRTQTSC